MEVFSELLLWMDPVRRPGPEAMAVDEWLLENAVKPVLRVYRWAGDWASIGYFGKIAEARAAFPGVNVVRRWSGGGMVDHRSDWTYSIIAPQGEVLATWRGAESYRRIHLVLAETLAAEEISCRLSAGEEETGANLCFENPVSHDLLGAGSRKLAGAGQRRSKNGLLHQGSLLAQAADDQVFYARSSEFARRLARNHESVDFSPERDDLSARVSARYANPIWIERR